MSDFQDDIVRGYSPEIMKRLLAFIKPYKISTLIAVSALLLSTGAELLMPILMRRALDDHLLRREYRLSISALESRKPETVVFEDLMQSGRRIKDSLFVEGDQLSGLSGREKDAARESGWLDEDEWYVFSADNPGISAVVERHPHLFESSNGWHAITLADRRTLEPGERRAIQSTDRAGLRSYSVVYLVLLTAVLLFTFVQVYAASWIGQRVMADMRGKLLGHIMRQSLRYLSRTPVGSLVSRTANDVETINEFFTNVAVSFLRDTAVMLGVIVVLFALDTRLSLISLTALVPTFVLIVVFRNRMRESFRRVRSRISSVNAFLSERLGGMITVQLFDSGKRSAEKFNRRGSALLDAELGQMRVMAVFRPVIDLIARVAVALVIWYSTGLYDSGLLTLGVLIAFIELIQKFFQPVTDIAEKFNILQSAMAGGERIFAMLDKEDRIPDQAPAEAYGKLTKDGVRGEIRFEKVEFSYVPGEPVLKGLSFFIDPGQTVAVVGATGAGKTTIANLITRLWDADGGRVLLDGRDVRNISLDALRRSVQPVQQDVFLFAGTIADNIDLGLGIPRERIVEAATLARADAFIQNLPEKYDTLLTEDAANFSAGQRQLIAFARVIAHDPRLIILDEATANVDTETETLLQEGLERLLADRTALVIAHRLSTIRRADRIMVLGHGRLIEEGTHEELLERRGVYYNLYRIQYAEGRVEKEAAL